MKDRFLLVLFFVFLLLLCSLSACASRSETEKENDTQTIYYDMAEGSSAISTINQMKDETTSFLDISTDSAVTLDSTSAAPAPSGEALTLESLELVDESTAVSSSVLSTEHSDLEMPEIEIPIGTVTEGETEVQESTVETDPSIMSSTEITKESSSDSSEESTEKQNAESSTNEDGDIVLPEL